MRLSIWATLFTPLPHPRYRIRDWSCMAGQRLPRLAVSRGLGAAWSAFLLHPCDNRQPIYTLQVARA